MFCLRNTFTAVLLHLLFLMQVKRKKRQQNVCLVPHLWINEATWTCISTSSFVSSSWRQSTASCCQIFPIYLVKTKKSPHIKMLASNTLTILNTVRWKYVPIIEKRIWKHINSLICLQQFKHCLFGTLKFTVWQSEPAIFRSWSGLERDPACQV